MVAGGGRRPEVAEEEDSPPKNKEPSGIFAIFTHIILQICQEVFNLEFLKDKWVWIKSIFIPVILGGIVALLISGSMDYNDLNRPPLSPPGFIFGIVWTVLYILMGVSYGIIASKDLVDKNINTIYYLQLFVNLLWPIAFFIFKWRLFAFIWLLLLIILVIKMIIDFYKKNQLSAYLQIPYLLWCTFAAYLNLGVYLLNK